jgi:hypothetical protein
MKDVEIKLYVKALKRGLKFFISLLEKIEKGEEI